MSRPTGATTPSSTGLDPHVAATLAYLVGWLSGLLFYFLEQTSGYVRFHAAQAIVGLGALWLAGLVCYTLAFMALFVSITGFVLLMWFAKIVWGAWIVLWMICLFKAYTGERWRMPLAGAVAERLAAR